MPQVFFRALPAILAENGSCMPILYIAQHYPWLGLSGLSPIPLLRAALNLTVSSCSNLKVVVMHIGYAQPDSDCGPGPYKGPPTVYMPLIYLFVHYYIATAGMPSADRRGPHPGFRQYGPRFSFLLYAPAAGPGTRAGARHRTPFPLPLPAIPPAAVMF